MSFPTGLSKQSYRNPFLASLAEEGSGRRVFAFKRLLNPLRWRGVLIADNLLFQAFFKPSNFYNNIPQERWPKIFEQKIGSARFCLDNVFDYCILTTRNKKH
jgi:hypothetical protein